MHKGLKMGLVTNMTVQDCMDWTSKDAILEEKDNGKLLVMDKFKVMRNLD